MHYLHKIDKDHNSIKLDASHPLIAHWFFLVSACWDFDDPRNLKVTKSIWTGRIIRNYIFSHSYQDIESLLSGLPSHILEPFWDSIASCLPSWPKSTFSLAIHHLLTLPNKKIIIKLSQLLDEGNKELANEISRQLPRHLAKNKSYYEENHVNVTIIIEKIKGSLYQSIPKNLGENPINNNLEILLGLLLYAYTLDSPDMDFYLSKFISLNEHKHSLYSELTPKENNTITENKTELFFRQLSNYVLDNEYEFDRANNIYLNFSDQSYLDLSQCMPISVNLIQIDEAINKLKKGHNDEIITLIRKYSQASQNTRQRHFCLTIINNVIPGASPKSKPYLCLLALSVLIQTILDQHIININKLSLDELFSIITTDVFSIPNFEAIIERLHQFPHETIAAKTKLAILDAQKDNIRYHLLIIVSRLTLVELTQSCIQTLHLCKERSIAIAFQIICQNPQISLDYIINHFSDFSSKLQDAILLVLGRLSHPMISIFIDRNFSTLWPVKKTAILQMMQVFPDISFIRLLDKYKNKGNSEIDKTYLLLHLLLGIRNKELRFLEKKINKNDIDKHNLIDFMNNSEVPIYFPTINLDLKCSLCQDISLYNCNRIVVFQSEKVYLADDFVIGQEIPCISCGQIPIFRPTSSGYESALAYFLALENLKNKHSYLFDHNSLGPFEIRTLPKNQLTVLLKLSDQGNKDCNIIDLIQVLEKNIKNKTKDFSSFISLAELYHILHHDSKAIQLFEHALKINPSSIIPYFFLAQIYSTKGDSLQAQAFIEKGHPFLEDAPPDEHDMIVKYQDLYDSLLEEEKVVIQDIDLAKLKQRKVGRNDPCPCGSGKKFKKCCLLLETVM